MVTAPRPELAKRLFAADAGLRVHVPAGSALLAQLETLGIRDVVSIDASASFGDPVVVDATLQTKDHTTAASTAEQVKDQVLRAGLLGWFLRIALDWDEQEPRTVVVEGSDVRLHLDVPRANLAAPEMLRQRMIRQYLR